MDESNSILKDVREALGVGRDVLDFDTEILMHVNSAVGTLTQNGVGLPVVITNDTTTWGELKNPNQVLGNVYFHLVPSYILMNTKIVFDPPPPSAVEHFSKTIDQLLWRLKTAYEEPLTTTTTLWEG